MPKEFLLAISQNEKLPLAVRLDAAKSLVGFYSPKLVAQNITARTEAIYSISDAPLSPDAWIAKFGKPVIADHSLRPAKMRPCCR
jgi:hypothetical protein